jgi:hypothetical protein
MRSELPPRRFIRPSLDGPPPRVPGLTPEEQRAIAAEREAERLRVKAIVEPLVAAAGGYVYEGGLQAERKLPKGPKGKCGPRYRGVVEVQAKWTKDVCTPRPAINLAAQIRDELKRQGASTYAVSQATGIPKSVISRFKRAKGDLSLENAGRLMGFLGFKVRVSKWDQPEWRRVEPRLYRDKRQRRELNMGHEGD